MSGRTFTLTDAQFKDLVGILASAGLRYSQELNDPGQFAYLRGVDAVLNSVYELLSVLTKKEPI